MHEKKQDDVSRFSFSKTKTYLLALALVAGLSVGAYFTMQKVVRALAVKSSIAALNGRQRLLSQRIALYSEYLAQAKVAQRDEQREKLMDLVDRFSNNHHALSKGSAELGAPSVAVKELYFGTSEPLDQDIQDYILSVYSLLKVEAQGSQKFAPDLMKIRSFQAKLLPKLERASSLHLQESEDRVANFQRIEMLILAFTLAILALEAFFIFAPMSRSISTLIESTVEAEDLAARAQEELAKKSVPPGAPWGSGMSVLLVDDNAVNQKIIAGQLAVMGFQVQWAENGRAAVQAALSTDFDLVLMDCEMPEMDGFEASKEIRRIESRRNVSPVPILAMSGYAAEDIANKCLEAGMSAFVSKPIRREALATKLQEWLRTA